MQESASTFIISVINLALNFVYMGYLVLNCYDPQGKQIDEAAQVGAAVAAVLAARPSAVRSEHLPRPSLESAWLCSVSTRKRPDPNSCKEVWVWSAKGHPFSGHLKSEGSNVDRKLIRNQ